MILVIGDLSEHINAKTLKSYANKSDKELKDLIPKCTGALALQKTIKDDICMSIYA